MAEALVLSASAREGMPRNTFARSRSQRGSTAAELGLAEEAIMRCRQAGCTISGRWLLPDSRSGIPVS